MQHFTFETVISAPSRQHIKGLIVYGAKPEFSERTYLDQNAHKNDSHNIHRDSCNNFLFETLAQDFNS